MKIRHKPNPFFTEDIRDLMKERDCLHQKARKTGTKEDWKVFRERRNRVKVALREAEREYYNQEICENKNNCGAIWKTICSALPNKTGRASFTDTLANEFNHFCTSVGEKAARDSAELAQSHSLSNLSIPFNLCPSQTSDELFEFKEVTSDDVRKVNMAMPSNKAPGYDRILLFAIKDRLPYVLPTLTALANLSFASSAFPRAWKKSVVVPRHKDGDHQIPNNNRPISLLPVLSKLTEKIALNQFNDFLTQQGNLTCHQSGNRKYHSTETLSLLVTGHIFKAMDKKEITAMVLTYLSKALDSISHMSLRLKLQGLGASSTASKWFQSYLTDRMQSTRLALRN